MYRHIIRDSINVEWWISLYTILLGEFSTWFPFLLLICLVSHLRSLYFRFFSLRSMSLDGRHAIADLIGGGLALDSHDVNTERVVQQNKDQYACVAREKVDLHRYIIYYIALYLSLSLSSSSLSLYLCFSLHNPTAISTFYLFIYLFLHEFLSFSAWHEVFYIYLCIRILFHFYFPLLSFVLFCFTDSFIYNSVSRLTERDLTFRFFSSVHTSTRCLWFLSFLRSVLRDTVWSEVLYFWSSDNPIFEKHVSRIAEIAKISWSKLIPWRRWWKEILFFFFFFLTKIFKNIYWSVKYTFERFEDNFWLLLVNFDTLIVENFKCNSHFLLNSPTILLHYFASFRITWKI